MTAQPIQDHRTEATIENVRNRISVIEDLNARGIGTALWHQQFELSCLRALLAAHEQEPVANHIGSKNALDAIVAFIKSNSNPTLNDYNSVSERLFADNCQSLSSHVIEYITRIGEALEDLRQDAVHPAPVPAVPECFERLLAHAQGIAMGVDWNKGTAATHHRDKLCQAVKDCAAMLNGGKS